MEYCVKYVNDLKKLMVDASETEKDLESMKIVEESSDVIERKKKRKKKYNEIFILERSVKKNKK
jgi:hypothetical protein